MIMVHQDQTMEKQVKNMTATPFFLPRQNPPGSVTIMLNTYKNSPVFLTVMV